MGLPACALERDIAAGLLGRQYGFFRVSVMVKPLVFAIFYLF
jgi:hypothetical protein